MHDAGIEVILDVVYNHTAEGNQLGPTLSFRGIDNMSYYCLRPGAERYYSDFTGTGNALELRHPYVLRMVMDSLRYWEQEMGVFRFDLATTLARVNGEYTEHAGFLDAQAKALAVRLSGEPGLMHLTERGEQEPDETFLILANASHDDVTFRILTDPAAASWEVVVDTE
jgi:isoamylase